MFAIFSEEQIVVSALKRPRTVSKSSTIMSVITAKQIKQMGSRTLMDVLKTVPDFDIQMNEIGERMITARGIKFQNKIKVLIDGHSVNHPWDGDISFTFYDLVVENIKRVEISWGQVQPCMVRMRSSQLLTS